MAGSKLHRAGAGVSVRAEQRAGTGEAAGRRFNRAARRHGRVIIAIMDINTGRWTAVALCVVAAGAASGIWGPESVRADAVPLAARCADAGVRPLPLLRGHLNLNRRPGFSVPELIVHFRTPALPRGCEARFQRTIAVSVGVKLRGRPGILSIGRDFRPVEWLTFVVGFKAKGPEREGLVSGIAFSEKLPCTEKLIGHVRYRVTTDSGRVRRERIAPFRPSFARCGAATG